MAEKEMRKRILFFSHAMEIGGAEKVLLGLLEAIDTSRYEVDLFLMRHSGELLKEIPQKIHLLPERPEYASLAVPLGSVMRKRQIGVAFGRATGKYLANRRVKQLGLMGENDVSLIYSHKYTARFMPPVGEGTYDLAISFLTPHFFVSEKVRAKRKVAWIHTDYSKIAVDRETQLEMWGQYDKIVSISPQVTAGFTETFPELERRIIEIGHILPTGYIRERGLEKDITGEMPADGAIRLLSIGRFCKAKNFDSVPTICKLIREAGLNVEWYLIGYGGDEELIHRRIVEAGMQEYVIVLGKKENPYPYIEACDLYVQPSRYEGKCVSVIEAQILQKPVAITAYPTSGSQLEDSVDGVIVPMDNAGCAAEIVKLLQDPDRMETLRRNCAERDYSNSGEIKKLYRMMEQ